MTAHWTKLLVYLPLWSCHENCARPYMYTFYSCTVIPNSCLTLGSSIWAHFHSVLVCNYMYDTYYDGAILHMNSIFLCVFIISLSTITCPCYILYYIYVLWPCWNKLYINSSYEVSSKSVQNIFFSILKSQKQKYTITVVAAF